MTNYADEWGNPSQINIITTGTLALNNAAADSKAFSRTNFAYNTVWVRQNHATENAQVIIEASPHAPVTDDNFWVPIAALSVDTSLDAANRTAVLQLPVGAWRLFRVRVTAETGVGANVDVVITSHSQASY